MLSFTFPNPLQSSREITIKIRSGGWLTTSKEVCRGKFEKMFFTNKLNLWYNDVITSSWSYYYVITTWHRQSQNSRTIQLMFLWCVMKVFNKKLWFYLFRQHYDVTMTSYWRHLGVIFTPNLCHVVIYEM